VVGACFAWEELKYWARTQMKSGQIHHDTNRMEVGADRALRSVMVDWDDTEHADYRNIVKWVDLNAGFIISAWETYEATNDRAQFDAIWPNVQRAAQRILDRVEQYGNRQYPYTFDHSENSYDAGGDPNPFNANISAVAYRIMVLLAREKGNAALAARYQLAYDTVVTSFRARYLNDAGFRLGKHSEGYYGGQWLAQHMKLGEIWSRWQRRSAARSSTSACPRCGATTTISLATIAMRAARRCGSRRSCCRACSTG
jgi:hypothetical protein